MNTKGFTLIELTAIIVVLAAIFLVSFPSLLNMAKADEEKKYEDMVENICMAGRTYIYNKYDSYESQITEGSKIEIQIQELIKYGSIDKNVKNPKTDKSIENDVLRYKVADDNYLECTYIEK